MSTNHVSRGSTAWRWRKLRTHALAQTGGKCADCHARAATEVHHLLAQHEHPEHALDPRYLLPLCAECHKVRSAQQRGGEPGGQHPYPTRFSREW